MSTYRKALSRIGVLAVLLTGTVTLTKPAGAVVLDCLQTCTSEFNACVAICRENPRLMGCLENCGSECEDRKAGC